MTPTNGKVCLDTASPTGQETAKPTSEGVVAVFHIFRTYCKRTRAVRATDSAL